MTNRKPSIKYITVKKLLALAFVVIAILTVWIGYSFQRLLTEAMKDKGATIARVVEMSLASHMEASALEQKNVYLEKLRHVVGLTDIRLIRSDAVTRQFSLPSDAESRKDPVIGLAFSSGQPQYVLPSLDGGDVSLRVAFPYRSLPDNAIVCQDCHDVESGSVLGVVDFRIDMSNYLGMSLRFLYLFWAAFFLIFLGIVTAIFQVIDRHIKAPLEDLIHNTMSAYSTHIAIDLDRYESMELDYVAEKVNEFTMDILTKQTELEGKNRELSLLNTEIEETQREIIHTMGEVAERRSKETADMCAACPITPCCWRANPACLKKIACCFSTPPPCTTSARWEFPTKFLTNRRV